MASRSFVFLFVTSTNMYLFDMFMEAYAKNTLSLELEERISSIFGRGLVVSIYLAAVLEALGLSILVGYIVTWIRKSNKS